MTDKARELLERVLIQFGKWHMQAEYDWDSEYDLKKEIEDFLSTPEPTQEPIGYVITIDPSKSYRKDSWVPWKEVEGMNGGKIRDDIPDGSFVYLHPAPRPEFVRLSEEEIEDCSIRTVSVTAFANAIQDLLEEKNK